MVLPMGKKRWVAYEDGTYEPVDPQGDLRKKKRDPNRPDWWVVEEDEDWEPPVHRDRSKKKPSLAGKNGPGLSPGKDKRKKTNRDKDLYYWEQGACQGFADCAGEIVDGFRELGEKAPKGIGKALSEGAKGAVKAGKRLGHELKTNDKFRNTLVGAGALPAAIAASPSVLPHVAGAARAVGGSLLANPEAVKQGTDFLQGLAIKGAPPPSPAGYLGTAVDRAIEEIEDD